MKLVLISDKSYREGVNNIGDIVSWHDSDVELGPAYSSFEIVTVKDVSVADFIAKANLVLPEVKTASRLNAPQNEWTIEEPEQVSVFSDNGEWRVVETRKKYPLRLDLSKKESLDSTSIKEALLPTVKDGNEKTITINQATKTEIVGVK